MTDELDTAIKDALAEVLNLAAQVVELQLDDTIRSDLYELLDSVADYYGINREEHTDGTEETAQLPQRPHWIKLIVNNDDNNNSKD